MELKDIVLKKGDRVYYKLDNKSVAVQTIEDCFIDKNVLSIYDEEIIKIERPYYETIYEAPKQILDKEEKEWLEHFLRPFIKARIRVIKSVPFDYVSKYASEELTIMIEDCEVDLPPFSKDTMYKGMELDKEYTLKELGLFED